MRNLFLIGMVSLVLFGVSSGAMAWDFAMTGEAEWRYRYWTRTGTEDIFGSMGNDVYLGINHLKTFPTTRSTNRGSGTFGVMAGENRFGADMNLNDMRVTFYPKVSLNKAVDISAGLNLTSLGIWSDGEVYDSSGRANPGYVNSLYVPIQDRPVTSNVPHTYLTLHWLKLHMKTPSFTLSLGYRTSPWGLGLWMSGCNWASASFSMSNDYGPFRFTFGPYLARSRSEWTLGSARSRNEGPTAAERKEDRWNFFGAVHFEVEYRNGPLMMKALSSSYYQPGAQVPDARGETINTTRIPTADTLRYRLAAAVRYFNGRFFFHGEADWFNRWTSGRGTAVSANLVQQDLNNDAWIYGFELGTLVGPSKLTVNYLRATGNDPSTRVTTESAADSQDGLSACYMKSWGYLMYFLYGTGDGWDATGNGQPDNFHHAGVRLDHAVASNLNVYGLCSFAWRDHPNEYRLGGDYKLGMRLWTNDDIYARQQGRGVGSAVPDHARFIGWEVDFGLDWKLLENFTVSSTFAFWQPGNWWSYAFPNTAAIYRAIGTPNSNTDTAAGEALAIIGLGRSIAPLFAIETTLRTDF
jgi:hypothetical protein